MCLKKRFKLLLPHVEASVDLAYEMSNVSSELFDLSYAIIKQAGDKAVSQRSINKLNSYGRTCL